MRKLTKKEKQKREHETSKLTYEELTNQKDLFYKNYLENKIELLWEDIVFRRVFKDGYDEDEAILLANNLVGKTKKAQLEKAKSGELDILEQHLKEETQQRLKLMMEYVKEESKFSPELLESLSEIEDDERDFGINKYCEYVSSEYNSLYKDSFNNGYEFIQDYYNVELLEREIQNYILSLHNLPLLYLDHSSDPPYDCSGETKESEFLINISLFEYIKDLYRLYTGQNEAIFVSGCGFHWKIVEEDILYIINAFVYDSDNLLNKDALVEKLKEIKYIPSGKLNKCDAIGEEDIDYILTEFICDSLFEHALTIKFGNMPIKDFTFFN